MDFTDLLDMPLSQAIEIAIAQERDRIAGLFCGHCKAGDPWRITDDPIMINWEEGHKHGVEHELITNNGSKCWGWSCGAAVIRLDQEGKL